MTILLSHFCWNKIGIVEGDNAIVLLLLKQNRDCRVLPTSPGEMLRLSMITSIIFYGHVTINDPIENIHMQWAVIIQIPPSVSTIIISGWTQSFVGLEESVTLKIGQQNRPTKSSQVGVRVSHVGVRVSTLR